MSSLYDYNLISNLYISNLYLNHILYENMILGKILNKLLISNIEFNDSFPVIKLS